MLPEIRKQSVQALFATVCVGSSTQNETPMVREYLQIGGNYVENAVGEHVLQNQIYVEHLTPVGGATQPAPIVMIHGTAQTATNWLNKPDGTKGWASLFIEQGFELYLVDQPSRGRSTWQPTTGPPISPPYSTEYIQRYFTAPEKYDPQWPQATRHTQWPGTGQRGDPIFDRFYASQVQYTANLTYQQTTTRAAGAALLAETIGKPAFVLGHSSGGTLPLVIADTAAAAPFVAGLILLEPSGPPFANQAPLNTSASSGVRPWGVADVPLTYEPAVTTDPGVELVRQTVAPPPPVDDDDDAEERDACVLQAETPAPRRLVRLADVPMLVVTSESSYHAPYDYCTVAYLRQAGCGLVEHVELAKVGIRGNGHMMFLEKNSDDVQDVVRNWTMTVVQSGRL